MRRFISAALILALGALLSANEQRIVQIALNATTRSHNKTSELEKSVSAKRYIAGTWEVPAGWKIVQVLGLEHDKVTSELSAYVVLEKDD